MSLSRRPPLAGGSRKNFYLLYSRQGAAPGNTGTARTLLSPLREAHGYPADFHADVREYNDLTSFASVGADLDLETLRRPGSYVYRIRGAMYRRIGSVSANDGVVRKFAKIYLFGTEAAEDFRIRNAGVRRRRPTLSALHDMMARCNPFPPLFTDCSPRARQEGHEDAHPIPRSDDDGLGRRSYNAPRSPEVAAVISGESPGKKRDDTQALQGGGVSMVDETQPCYDPISYALMRPRGNAAGH